MQRVAVLGTGLIGGSIGLSLHGRGIDVHGYDGDAPRLARAKELGAITLGFDTVEEAVAAGSGTVEQITERFAAMLEPGLIEHVDLQLPTGDMTFDEARRTFELFASEVKPQLEQASLASAT